MKRLLIVIGGLLLILGIIFTGQSYSVIGPKSSFMYDNHSWTVNGFILIVAGIVVLALGLIFNSVLIHK
jgi:hypothetical protein